MYGDGCHHHGENQRYRDPAYGESDQQQDGAKVLCVGGEVGHHFRKRQPESPVGVAKPVDNVLFGSQVTAAGIVAHAIQSGIIKFMRTAHPENGYQVQA